MFRRKKIQPEEAADDFEYEYVDVDSEDFDPNDDSIEWIEVEEDVEAEVDDASTNAAPGDDYTVGNTAPATPPVTPAADPQRSDNPVPPPPAAERPAAPSAAPAATDASQTQVITSMPDDAAAPESEADSTTRVARRSRRPLGVLVGVVFAVLMYAAHAWKPDDVGVFLSVDADKGLFIVAGVLCLATVLCAEYLPLPLQWAFGALFALSLGFLAVAAFEQGGNYWLWGSLIAGLIAFVGVGTLRKSD